MTARFLIGDVFDRMAELDDGTVDLIVTSPPFLALRSYLPADHPDKGKEIGSETNPAEFIDTLLALTAEWGRVLAPHGSIAVELGDTYASGGTGTRPVKASPDKQSHRDMGEGFVALGGGPGWPLSKCKAMIPELYRVALAYGLNPLTGTPSPAGRWRVRNVVTWCRPNPPVGALGDKWRPATSDIVVATRSGKRYWDDLATRTPSATAGKPFHGYKNQDVRPNTGWGDRPPGSFNPSGAPLLDYWVIPPGGYQGAHYAVYPPALVEPLIQAMAPPRICTTCGEPARRIVEQTPEYAQFRARKNQGERTPTGHTDNVGNRAQSWDTTANESAARGQTYATSGWSDCGHNTWRPAHILDPFAGSGTTLAVATGHGHTATGIDIDERNADLALERVGPLILTVEH